MLFYQVIQCYGFSLPYFTCAVNGVSGVSWFVYSYFEKGCRKKCTRQSQKALVGFEFSVLQRNLKELARKAMEMCFLVLKESDKVGSTATVVRNSVLIISHITFRDCLVHIFSDNLSRNSCIQM